MEQEWDYRAMLATDIERSAGRGNTALLRIREVLTTALRAAFEESGIDWEACLRTDLGDGLRVIAPSKVRKARLIHPLVHELAVRLRAHNRTAGAATRVRVRMALHAGELRVGPAGEVTGQPLEVLARMLDAAPSRSALAAAPESVTTSLLVSQHFYEDTVQHGYPGIDPESFRKVRLHEKEHTADAWLHLPGHPAVPQEPPMPGPQRPEDEGADGGSGAGHSKMINRASGNGVIYATQNGNIHLTGRP
ncbi:hypothetical protein ACZ90_39270 [Streptomyces albus subsp. albus]|nr:hypothetical protein ACZ90_39270 [Streptomyces albus subsp. albus]